MCVHAYICSENEHMPLFTGSDLCEPPSSSSLVRVRSVASTVCETETGNRGVDTRASGQRCEQCSARLQNSHNHRSSQGKIFHPRILCVLESEDLKAASWNCISRSLCSRENDFKGCGCYSFKCRRVKQQRFTTLKVFFVYL